MKILLTAFCIFVLLFEGVKQSTAHPSNDDASITDVQEFNVDGIEVLLRESKETPVVTADLFIRGGTSIMAENEPATTEYFAMNLIPESGTALTSKQRFRRVEMRMGSELAVRRRT